MWAMGNLFSRRILLDEDWSETGVENENPVLESCSETGRSSTLTSRVPLQPMSSPASPVIASLSKMSLVRRSLGSGLPNVRYFSDAASAAERIMEDMKRVPKIDSESTEGEVFVNVSGEVEFKEVEFAYPSCPESQILRGFNLQVPTGKTVALVGSSGSGKSTVIALLERFYDPSKGEILLDGVHVRKFQIKWLRLQMRLVNQEPALFATSIKENILFGKEDVTMEEVVAAAKASNAHNYISELPLGYDTVED